MSNMEIPTKSIAYNYGITRGLFDSKNMRIIDNEIVKLINMQIDLIVNYYDNPTAAMDKLTLVKKVFFKDAINEQGQIGIPLINVNGTYKQLQTINELKEDFIPALNFREKMTMLKNFISKQNDCIMYSILVEYNRITKQGGITNFTNKYPMLNTIGLDKTVDVVESILGFDIAETESCLQILLATSQ